MGIRSSYWPQASAVGLMSAGILAASTASGATYADTYAGDPATFKCAFFGSVEACGLIEAIPGGPRTLKAGDHLTETVNFTSTVTTPASTQKSLVYVELFDAKVPDGPAIPGDNLAYVVTAMRDYSGPPGFYTSYVSSPLHKYSASGGFSGTSSPGFSLSGFTSDFYILKGDTDPIIGVDFGYFAALDYTPQVIADLAGGTADIPRILPSGHVGSISSSISGGTSASEQYYSFRWETGDFAAVASITGANPLADFHYQLLDGVTHDVLVDLILDAANGFTKQLNYDGLAGGIYELGLYTDSPYDPQFSLTFNTPVLSSAPEPSAWLLMLAGFGICGAVLRRRSWAQASPG